MWSGRLRGEHSASSPTRWLLVAEMWRATAWWSVAMALNDSGSLALARLDPRVAAGRGGLGTRTEF